MRIPTHFAIWKRLMDCGRPRPLSVAGLWGVLFCLCAGIDTTNAADFNVTTPNSQFAFRINNVDSPTLTLVRGETYTFSISTTPNFHPFRINSMGVSNNNISSGMMTYIVPTNAANYFYDCTVHGQTMRGEIVTIPPPTIRIVKLDVGANLVLKSTGTNNWTLIPQFSTNLGSTNWFALTVQSNRFLSGTNETFCGRPPDSNVFVRIRAQRN